MESKGALDAESCQTLFSANTNGVVKYKPDKQTFFLSNIGVQYFISENLSLLIILLSSTGSSIP